MLASIGGIASLSLGVGGVSATGTDSERERVPIDTGEVGGIDEAYVIASGDQRKTVMRGTVTPSMRAGNATGAVYSVDATENKESSLSDSVSATVSKVDTTPEIGTSSATSDGTTEEVTTSGVGSGSKTGTDPTNDYEGGAFVTHHDMHGTMTLAKSEQHISWEQSNGEVDWIWRGHRYETGAEWSGQTELNGIDWSGDTVLSRVAGNYSQSVLNTTIDHRVNLTGKPNGEMDWEVIWWCSDTGNEWGYNTGIYYENQMR